MMRVYFGVDDILDLKDPAVANLIGLQWIEFAHLPDDESFLHVLGQTMTCFFSVMTPPRGYHRIW